MVDHIQNLKTNTNQMTNEEHQTKNDVEVDYGRNSVAPWPRFLFFLLLLSNFSIEGVWDFGSSPRWVVASNWSNLAHPGELVTSPLSYLGA